MEFSFAIAVTAAAVGFLVGLTGVGQIATNAIPVMIAKGLNKANPGIDLLSSSKSRMTLALIVSFTHCADGITLLA